MTIPDDPEPISTPLHKAALERIRGRVAARELASLEAQRAGRPLPPDDGSRRILAAQRERLRELASTTRHSTETLEELAAVFERLTPPPAISFPQFVDMLGAFAHPLEVAKALELFQSRELERLRFERPEPRSPRWRFLKVQRITGPDGDLYLWRLYLIETPFGGIKLHRIIRPDHDRAMHDHPWDFLSIVLRGGYTEAVEPKGFVPSRHVVAVHPWRRIRWASFHRAEDLHRIVKLERNRPAWTLVLSGRKRRAWGFVEGPGAPWERWDLYLERIGRQPNGLAVQPPPASV